MAGFNCFLDKTSYSWLNALLWGNFVGHCKKAGQGSLGDRIVHVFIAAIEFLPIISQISSICEKLIIDNFSSTISSPKALSLTDKRVSIETSKEKHKKFPTPPSLINNESESLEKNKEILLNSLSKNIENQRTHKTYKRATLASLQEQEHNLPVPLASVAKKVKCFSENATFYSYNAEGIRDYGWGCA